MVSTLNRSRFGFPTQAGARFPSCVQLTLCHYICNIDCLSCPVGRLNRGNPEAYAQWEADGAKRLFMPWKVFEKATRETGQHPSSFLRFHARGEPTLHPRFIDMLAYAKEVGVVGRRRDGVRVASENRRMVAVVSMILTSTDRCRESPDHISSTTRDT